MIFCSHERDCLDDEIHLRLWAMKSSSIFLLKFCFFIGLSLSSAAIAQVENKDTGKTTKTGSSQSPPSDEPTLGEKVKKETDKVQRAMSEARERREQAFGYALFNYSHIDMLVPAKYGVSAGWQRGADTAWELEYLKGSISVPFAIQDLGSMTDERISLTRRSFLGTNSFNMSFGLTYFRFAIHLGSSLLNRVSGGNYPSLDMVDIQGLGANFAVGNRWTFSHGITFGVDWFSWYQPLYSLKREANFLTYATNQEDKDNVDTAIKVISYLPRFAFLKLQLGILF